MCFGKVVVKKDEALKTGSVLSISPDGEPNCVTELAEKIWVKEINPVRANVGGEEVEAHNVIITIRRHFKDGVKITNMAANKGVIRLKDLGYATDPRTGERRKIDVIVSAKAVKKRKNGSQILEALVNNLFGEKVTVFNDFAEANIDSIKNRLKNAGLPEDGCWECNTQFGKFRAVTGKVFWGVTKDVEDQLWNERDTIRRNGRELRTAGIKLSTVEIRALTTRFGKDNPIVDEILSYAQGSEDLHELIKVLKSMEGELPDAPVLPCTKLPVVDTKDSLAAPYSMLHPRQ